jgi:hypothetical protein
MGSLCSKPSNHFGGHTVLGSASEGNSPVDARAAAAAAADKRRAAVSFPEELTESLTKLGIGTK